MEASSTCEVMFEVFDEDKISLKTAEALYLGIVHDTGVFKHSNTTERTMTIAGKLLSKGVLSAQIIDESFIKRHIFKIKYWEDVYLRVFLCLMINALCQHLVKR